MAHCTKKQTYSFMLQLSQAEKDALKHFIGHTSATQRMSISDIDRQEDNCLSEIFKALYNSEKEGGE